MDRSAELEVALDVEDRLAILLVSSPSLAELPIAPLRGVDDLVRLELALQRFATIHRSRRSKVLISGIRTLLGMARGKLRTDSLGSRAGSHVNQTRIRDTRLVA